MRHNFMKDALNQARLAYDKGEVPVGAVIVKDGKIICSSHNLCEENSDCTCHAEMNVIREAMKILEKKQLSDCELYVTVEPCPMCAGAIGNARIKRVYIGCEEPKSGSFGSVLNLNGIMPWSTEVYLGFCEDECRKLMKDFFEDKRQSR